MNIHRKTLVVSNLRTGPDLLPKIWTDGSDHCIN